MKDLTPFIILVKPTLKLTFIDSNTLFSPTGQLLVLSLSHYFYVLI